VETRISNMDAGPMGRVSYFRQTEPEFADNWKDEIKIRFQNESKTSNTRCLVPGRAFVFWRDGIITYVVRMPNCLLFISKKGEEPMAGTIRQYRSFRSPCDSSQSQEVSSPPPANPKKASEEAGVAIGKTCSCSNGVCKI